MGQNLDTLQVKNKNFSQQIFKNEVVYYKPRMTAFIVPAVFIGYGLISLGNNAIRKLDLSTRDELQEDHPLFAAHLDDYLQFVPAAAVYGLNLAGIKGKHSLPDATALLLVSEGIMGGTVVIAKKAVGRERPDHSEFNSFPSGHTANAFAMAEFLNQEYGSISAWYSIAGYTAATATGVLRLYNNKHWVSDVVTGAGVGILSTKVAYLIYPKLKQLVLGKKGTNYSFVPVYQQHNVGFSFNGTF